MGLFLDLQNKFKNSLWLIVVFLVFIYFSFYTVNGERGLLRYMYLSKEIKYARQVAEQYNAESVNSSRKSACFLQTALTLICWKNVRALFLILQQMTNLSFWTAMKNK